MAPQMMVLPTLLPPACPCCDVRGLLCRTWQYIATLHLASYMILTQPGLGTLILSISQVLGLSVKNLRSDNATKAELEPVWLSFRLATEHEGLGQGAPRALGEVGTELAWRVPHRQQLGPGLREMDWQEEQCGVDSGH